MQMQMQMRAMSQMAAQMQMAQMAQMQAMMAMQMPMGAGFGMPAMSGMRGQQPQLPAMSAEEAAEAAELARATVDDLALLELEVKQAEQKAKDTARLKDAYVGLMSRYIDDEGFGFISCAECKDRWEKTDIFLSGRNFMSAGVDVGDMLQFQVEKDGKNLPRACNPKLLQELTKLRRRLLKMRDALRTTAPVGQKRIHGGQEVAVPTFPEPKRPRLAPGAVPALVPPAGIAIVRPWQS
mmetsp:Transcript_118355/g.377273  ORF Transcript_118355/g.377273 Transcript_118355/m.377273 type:complete len:238 (+) Transcript_118355:3-716(+)